VESTWQLPWGSSVTAKITTYNTYGYSEESPAGNGAIILTYPDAPINLVETVAARTPTSITFEWQDGASNGGATVTDYRIAFDQSTGDYPVRGALINTQQYTVSSLTAGLTYKFKVEARNSYGYSVYSEPVAILCAAEPAEPAMPTT